MDPARMFKESLTSRPELENSQGQQPISSACLTHVRFAPEADQPAPAGMSATGQKRNWEQNQFLVLLD